TAVGPEDRVDLRDPGRAAAHAVRGAGLDLLDRGGRGGGRDRGDRGGRLDRGGGGLDGAAGRLDRRGAPRGRRRAAGDADELDVGAAHLPDFHHGVVVVAFKGGEL